MKITSYSHAQDGPLRMFKVVSHFLASEAATMEATNDEIASSRLLSMKKRYRSAPRGGFVILPGGGKAFPGEVKRPRFHDYFRERQQRLRLNEEVSPVCRTMKLNDRPATVLSRQRKDSPTTLSPTSLPRLPSPAFFAKKPSMATSMASEDE